MKTSKFFPWLNKKAAQAGSPDSARIGSPPPFPSQRTGTVLWLRERPKSLRSQHVSRRPLRDRMATIEHRLLACPLAPVQEQIQTVWFHLVHEYIKSKKKGSQHDYSSVR